MTTHESCAEFGQAMNVVLNADSKLLASAKILIENEIENRLKGGNIPESCWRYHELKMGE